MHLEDSNGFITIKDNPISKSGVFDYLGSQISSELNPTQVYKVWRPEEELNNPETIESFKLMPWIPSHVMLGDGYKDAEKVGVQGVTGEDVYFKDGTLFAKLRLLGRDLKEKIKSGLAELSCGFKCTWQIISGTTPDGQRYDVIQRNIRGNHLASVNEARMGHDVRVALDSAIMSKIEEVMEIKELLDSFNSIAETFKGIAQDMKDTKEAADAAAKEAEDAKAMEEAKDAKEKEKEKEEAEDAKEKEDKAEDAKVSKALDKLEKMEEKVNSLTAMDEAYLLKTISERNELAEKATNIVGEFNYSGMTTLDVAKYSLEKMGIACDSGSEVGMLKGILTAQQQRTFVTEGAQDSSIVSKAIPELSKLGL